LENVHMSPGGPRGWICTKFGTTGLFTDLIICDSFLAISLGFFISVRATCVVLDAPESQKRHNGVGWCSSVTVGTDTIQLPAQCAGAQQMTDSRVRLMVGTSVPSLY